MSFVKCGLAAVLAVGGALALAAPARAQYVTVQVPTVGVTVGVPAPAPYVYTAAYPAYYPAAAYYPTPAYYPAPVYYPGAVVVRPRPVVAVVGAPVRWAVATVRPRIFIP